MIGAIERSALHCITLLNDCETRILENPPYGRLSSILGLKICLSAIGEVVSLCGILLFRRFYGCGSGLLF